MNNTQVEASQPLTAQTAEPVTIKTLLDAGAHFGHQTERWNPKMMPYIYGARNNVHIINLDLTLKLWERSRKFAADIVSRGGSVLFVGTKPQAREIVKAEAERCGAFHVTTRWLGGTLSNFQTIRNSLERMKKMETLLVQAEDPNSGVKINKKEKLTLARQLAKLEGSLGGIRQMRRVPDLVFVVDINKEEIAVAESKKLKIPVMALVDTNVNPEQIDFPIPSNDDAVRAIKLFAASLADAVLQGRVEYEARRAKEAKEDKERSSKGKNRDSGEAAAGADVQGAVSLN